MKGFISLKLLIIILVIAVFVVSLETTALVLYEQGKLGLVWNKISKIFTGSGDQSERELTVKEREDELDEETRKRIEELEKKIKELEENQQVPFPPDDFFLPPLTQEQISSVVQLWCPDDNYNYNGFMSLGSGSIVTPDGLIITNRHVISNEDWSVIMSLPTCYVAITDDISQPPKVKYTANLIAYSPETFEYSESGYSFDFDVAVLYINDICRECMDAPDFLPPSFSYLDMGYSDLLSPGDYIAIAGYPAIGADTFTFTDGIVSGRVGEFVIKTDAKIDSGNSGGSALNSKNELVGVPTWTISGRAESLGYIIGIDQVINWYEQKVMPSDSLEVPY